MAEVKGILNKYLDGLSQTFNEDFFKDFISDLLNLTEDDIINEPAKNAGSVYKEYIEYSKYYAKYIDDDNNIIGVFIIKLYKGKKTANSRTLQRNFVAHLLEYYGLSAAIVSIFSESDEDWRLSFVKQELHISVGKIKKTLTPAKRYSYLFGKNEPNHTAKIQLLSLLENNTRKYTLNEIEDKFSVEKVTKDFFEQYKNKYLELKEMLEKNEEFISESQKCDFTSEEFTKKFMGQLVFIYFLQKKGWLGVKLVPKVLSFDEYSKIYSSVSDPLKKKILDKYFINQNGQKRIVNSLLEDNNEDEIDILSSIFVDTKFDEPWGTGTKRFIRDIFTNCVNRNKNFFDDYLEPFFYEGLNHKRANQYFSRFNCKIPFLNGGLFEPLDNYQWKVAQFNINNDIFSNKEKTGILDFFEQYNFTMDEEEPLEKDVAVDPEMLGKIFENLLDVKDRKSKGAFYTPREIVHYMCQESLANFLVNKVGVDYDEIKEFIQYGEMIRDVDLKSATKESHLVGNTIFDNVTNIDRALENIKIADPAVGSGAFPLGMLNEIVKIRDILTSYMLIYNRLGLWGKKYNESDILNKRNIYNIKWNTIKNSIYAVDIENSAVDITKLRLWLSIVVDQVDVPKAGPEPLPNLDCKIMQGNSLIDEYDGTKLINDELIQDVKNGIEIKNSNSNRKNIANQFSFIDIDSSNQVALFDDQKRTLIGNLVRAKDELYGTNNSDRKKELINKINDYRKELFKYNFIGKSESYEKLLEIDKSHNKPYFSWKLEFIEVFINNYGFDIVIGNPPYIDSESMCNNEIMKNEREFIINHYKYTKGNWDIYIAFFELGFNLLDKYGNLIYITPDKWISKSFGNTLRIGLIDNIQTIFFAGRDIFKSAKVDSIVTTINKFTKENIEVREYLDSKIVEKQIVSKSILISPFNLDIIFSKKINIINKIEKENHKRISDYCVVENACATSDCYKLKEFIEDNKFINESEYYKIVNTGTIDKYMSKWGIKPMKYLKSDFEFPVVKKKVFLENFRNSYGLKAEKKKIIIKGMTHLDGMLDLGGEYIPGKSTIVMISDDINKLKALAGLVNSKYAISYIKERYSSATYNGGITFNKDMIKSLPVYDSFQDDIKYISKIVDSIMLGDENNDVLDDFFIQKYNLTEEEKKSFINKGE